jgi:hypothetical protein
MLTANLQGRIFELEDVRTWERNPQYYSDLIASSLASQTLFSHAPASERARRVLSKLRQTPRLIRAARANIKEPPGIYVKLGVETMRGALAFIDDELPRAFNDLDDLHLLGDLADAQTEASQAVKSYLHDLETDIGPKARASFRLGKDKFEKKLRLDEGLAMPADRLLAIATRELKATQEEFRALGWEMRVTTENGSHGEKNLVTQALQTELERRAPRRILFACSPTPMLKAVKQLAAEFKLPTKLSLDKHMECNIGICLTCVVPIKAAEGWEYQRSCTEGPVFDSRQIAWEAAQ